MAIFQSLFVACNLLVFFFPFLTLLLIVGPPLLAGFWHPSQSLIFWYGNTLKNCGHSLVQSILLN